MVRGGAVVSEDGQDPPFEPFDLTVQLGPDLVPWISAVSRLGHVHGIPRHDASVPPLADLLDGVFDYTDSVRFAESEPSPMLSAALGNLVFGEPVVLELFQATRGAAADLGRELLVRVLASPHLAVLPWELLPDPAHRHSERNGKYLALAPDASVVRLARGRSYPARSGALKPPLNLLIVLSSPVGREAGDDSLAFDIYEEKRALLAELQHLVSEGLLKVDVEDHPTLENLRRRIGAERRGYHLFHYLGHAEPDRLILEDPEGRRDDFGGAHFTEILRLCPDLRLAVFAGCETARAPGDPLAVDARGAVGWKHMLSLADRCVQDACPTVIGMQAVLPFRTERLFTRFFYQGVASGYSVAGALRLARGATRGDRHVGGDLLDWSVPVLFVGGTEPGPLLERSAKATPPEAIARHSLRLGMQQRDSRFFARDVALRQTVDLLSGSGAERVLIVSGPRGVGKTWMVDRALDELPGAHLQLYVRFDDLVHNVQHEFRAATRDNGDGPRGWSFRGLEEESALLRLCELVSELLARADGRQRDRNVEWAASKWWPWLVEELLSRRFVLVIDNFELMVEAEKALFRRLIPAWLLGVLEDSTVQRRRGDLPTLLEDILELVREPPATPRGLPPVRRKLLTQIQILARSINPTEADAGRLGQTAAEVLGGALELELELLRRSDMSLKDFTRKVRASVPSATEQTQLTEDLRRLDATRRVLRTALGNLAGRRSSRIALLGLELPETLLGSSGERDFVIRLGHLTWSETWRWIRRNLPGLLRYGDDYLCRLWPRIGPRLEHWEELERIVLRTPTSNLPLSKIVDQLVPARTVPAQGGRARTERPLRIAVAGPLIAGPAAVATAITRLAAEHLVGGRVTFGSDDAAALAILIDEPSPFRDDGSAADQAIQVWLERVAALEPDVLLLDYGSSSPLPFGNHGSERTWLRSVQHRALLIAAGGNRTPSEPHSDMVSIPASFPEVLAIGSLDETGAVQSYAEWTPSLRKPDLFMCDQLLGTALEEALIPEMRERQARGELGPGTHGASFAALHAVAAAVLVWATLPNLTPRGVRRLLETASHPIGGHREPAPRRLELASALSEARRQLIKRTLERGPCTLQAITALTGLDFQVASIMVHDLVSRNAVRRIPGSRLDRYELAVHA